MGTQLVLGGLMWDECGRIDVQVENALSTAHDYNNPRVTDIAGGSLADGDNGITWHNYGGAAQRFLSSTKYSRAGIGSRT